MISAGQTEESGDSSDIVVPEQAMQQVVPRILRWYFKPQNQPKTIYLANRRLQSSWLPSIKNIEFRLLSDEEIQQREISVYFFTSPEQTGGIFSIGFAFGNPDCEYIGDFWHFRISKQKVRLWENGAVGAGCDSSS